jgi:lipopolysaccharide/colanic/teichoic acid biosynthesis glycosyltransferase
MTKRLFDVVVGVALAILAIPVVLGLALVSAAAFRCWPFFVQQRVGLAGRQFWIVKIRTLPPTAPAAVDKFVVAAMPLPRWSTVLRSAHLDELPQLFLVPLGRMSLVGPRPEMVFLHEQGEAEFARRRVSVRPGCTGLWQVSRAATGLIWDAAEYDLFYVRHACLRLDVWILARTLRILTPHAGTLALTDIPRWTYRHRTPVPEAWVPESLRGVTQLVNEAAGQPRNHPPRLIDLTQGSLEGQVSPLSPRT